MPNNDSHHHVVKTTEQWQDRAVEYWVVPRGTLCVELTPEKKTKIKIGEGSKYYSQLPYICDGHDMSNYYTKEETDRLLDNLNRMAIQSTDVYDTKDDLPLAGNRLGDVRFVRSTSEQKVDPDVYLWNGSKWIYVGYDFANIDLDRYLTKTEFHSEFDPVRDKVDEMYPKMHTHDNKDVLDRTERPFTIADKEKLDSLENYDDTEIRELIHETGHVHWNKHILDTITEDKLWTVQDREKFESLHNYDDTELRNRMGVVESKAHTHTNKDILDQTTAPFKTEDKQKLDSLENYDIFIGTDGRYPGVKGLVPAPSTLDIGTFLSSDGTWKKAGFDSDFVGATPYMDGEHGLVPAPLMGEQSYFLRGDGTWARVKNGDKYKAGEGIYILSGETTSDSFPFEIFAKASRTSQYVIYGSAAGVGDWDGTNYTLSITVSAPGETTLTTQILYNARLYSGDYVDYSRQIIHHSKQDMRQYISLYNHSTYGTRGTFQTNTGSVIGNYNSYTGVTNYIEVNPGEVYLIKAFVPYGPYDGYFDTFHCIFDENHALTRYFSVRNVGAVTIEIQPGEKYARFVGTPADQMLQPGFLYKLEPYEEPCVLPSIILYPNKINTIDVSNTNKPSEIYFEAVSDEPLDPDDPMSEYTGIIYNDGVIDVTQEDPNNLNELTFHYRDDVDKTITIPTYELPIASDTTLGGIKVGNNLTIDPVTGVLDATGGGTTYVEGDGIEFGRPILETYQVLDKIRKPSGTTLTTDVMPSGTVDFFCDLKYYKYAGDSFLILCYDGERGSFCYTPAPTASGGWARMWIYTAHQNWYDLYLNGSFASSSPIVAHLRWGNTMSMSFDHTSTSAQNTPGVLPGHNRFKFDSNSDADLYWAKFYENSALVGELIPVIRQSDNVVGLFNTVTETFSTASGLTPGTPTGETIVIYDQSSTQNIPINVKLGDGLQFDANGAIEAIPYVEGDAISIEHPQISSTITHVKWVLLNTRNRSSAGDIVQVGEFELYDMDDQLLTYSSISATFGNGGTPTYGTDQYQQTLDKLIDGDTSLKMCCTNFTTSCGGLEITMELMNSIDIQDIKQYRYITANDLDVRDPVTWDLYVSSDGTDWTLVDRQVDDSTIPTARETSTAYYEITHPTSDELAISVKYGNGLRLDANGALEVVPGGGLTAGRGIEIDQTSHINDKLGVGLTFDSDDAVTLDETTDLVFNCDYSE